MDLELLKQKHETYNIHKKITIRKLNQKETAHEANIHYIIVRNLRK